MKDAAVIEMLVKVLPDIAKAVAEPLNNVDSITMYGDGNSGKMVGDIMTSLDKVTNGLGIDIRELVKATLTGKAIGSSIDVKVETPAKENIETKEIKSDL